MTIQQSMKLRFKVTMTPFLLDTMLKKFIPEDIAREYEDGEHDLDRLKVRVIKFLHAMGINDYPKILEDVNTIVHMALVDIYNPE